MWRDKLFTNETLYDHIIYVIVLIYLINCVRCFSVLGFQTFSFSFYFAVSSCSFFFFFLCIIDRDCMYFAISHGFAISLHFGKVLSVKSVWKTFRFCQHACSLWAILIIASYMFDPHTCTAKRKMNVTLRRPRSANNSSNSRNININNNNKNKNIDAYDADKTCSWSF